MDGLWVNPHRLCTRCGLTTGVELLDIGIVGIVGTRRNYKHNLMGVSPPRAGVLGPARHR